MDPRVGDCAGRCPERLGGGREAVGDLHPLALQLLVHLTERRVLAADVGDVVAADVGDAQILFVGAPALPELPRILAGTRGKPILLVGDSPGLAKQGVAINFFLKPDILGAGKQLRFQINPEAMEGRGLKVSADLYDVAQIVR